MEYIEGNTLEDFLNESGKLNIEQSLKIIRSVAKTVAISHDLDVLHRDLKPKNIIVRNIDKEDVVVLDFGLSFRTTFDRTITATAETMKNEYIALSQGTVPGEDRRDKTSDIVVLCLLLHTCMTLCVPRMLYDSENKPPHRWKSYLIQPAQASERQIAFLNSVFDRAFRPEKDLRFQSVQELLAALENVASPSTEAPKKSFSTILADSHAILTSSYLPAILQQHRQFTAPVATTINHRLALLATQAQNKFAVTIGGQTIAHALPFGEHEIHDVIVSNIHVVGDPSLRIILQYKIGVSNNESHLWRLIGKHRIIPLNPPPNVRRPNRNSTSTTENTIIQDWRMVLPYQGNSIPKSAIEIEVEEAVGLTIQKLIEILTNP